jgi:hypothetical protein
LQEDKKILRAAISKVEGNASSSFMQEDTGVDLSLLSSLGSNKRQVRKNALIALSEPTALARLPMNEAGLAELFLAQII